VRRARALSIIAVVLAGLAVAGCASEGDGDGASVDVPQIRAVVAGYTAAVAAGDGAKACSYLGEVMRTTFERQGLVLKLGGCAGYMDSLIERGRQRRGGKAPHIEVTSVRISKGATWAIARMRAPDGSTSTASLHWEHPGGWKIAPDLTGGPPMDTLTAPPTSTSPTI
jgi:outer membrane murein-binding lipoprotein Lpp